MSAKNMPDTTMLRALSSKRLASSRASLSPPAGSFPIRSYRVSRTRFSRGLVVASVM
jgi:hypothetical protein